MRIHIYLLLFYFFVGPGSAQQISHVDYVVKDSLVTIFYDLDSMDKKTCADVSLRFTDSTFQNIYPSHLSGDIYRVLPGKRKMIVWSVLRDTSVLNGNYRAEIEITKIWPSKITRGPSCAFLSMALPGLGDYFVDEDVFERGIRPHWISIAYGYAVYGVCHSVAELQNARKDYSRLYAESQLLNSSVSDVQLGYAKNKITGSENAVKLTAGLAAGIWLYDVIWVAHKGYQNKKQQLAHPKPKKVFVYVNPVNPGIGLVKNF